MKVVYVAGKFLGPTAWDIEQNIRAMWNKAVKRQLNRPPLRVGREL